MAKPDPPSELARPAASTIQDPPRTIGGIFGKLGPGLIIAGSIVGSGELIGATITGASAGFWLMWLIIIGCVIKVFVQVEFGRYTIVNGRTTIAGLSSVPGPSIELSPSGQPGGRKLRANWLVWYWVAMFLVSLGQLGGIVGGVGQAMAISVPLTEQGRRANAIQGELIDHKVRIAELRKRRTGASSEPLTEIVNAQNTIDNLELQLAAIGPTRDTALWASIITALTAVMLMVGRYRLIEVVSTVLVAGFTAVTILNVVALQWNAEWAVTWQDIVDGMSFRLPEPQPGAARSPLAVALATFGIIGVGANELIAYPYFCMEKGYARFTGPRDDSSAWAERARGWMRVMRWDAACSMVVYTFATLAFYLCGAAILGRIGMVPTNNDLIRTLTVMYEPVFGAAAPLLFLFGAFAVLYSTFFVANAGHARTVTDALVVLGVTADDETVRRRWIITFSGLFPLLSLAIFLWVGDPIGLVLASGVMQAIALPMLAGAGLYFRYRKCDPRLRPSPLWDVALLLSALGMLVAGAWLVLTKLFPALETL